MRAPWDPPLCAVTGFPTMTEDEAASVRRLVAALRDPDSVLGENRNKKQKEKRATAQRQDMIWRDARFKDAKSQWIDWLASHIKNWHWIKDIDAWATSIGLGYDDLIRLSGSRTVGPTF